MMSTYDHQADAADAKAVQQEAERVEERRRHVVTVEDIEKLQRGPRGETVYLADVIALFTKIRQEPK